MQVDGGKFVHDGPEDVQHAVLLLVDEAEVQFSDDLVEIIKQVDGEGLEAGILTSLAVDFHEDLLALQFVPDDHLLQAVEFNG